MMKHDESKLPKWAQKRLAEAREEVKTIEMIVLKTASFPKGISLEITSVIPPMVVLAGDSIKYDVNEIISLMIKSLERGAATTKGPTFSCVRNRYDS